MLTSSELSADPYRRVRVAERELKDTSEYESGGQTKRQQPGYGVFKLSVPFEDTITRRTHASISSLSATHDPQFYTRRSECTPSCKPGLD